MANIYMTNLITIVVLLLAIVHSQTPAPLYCDPANPGTKKNVFEEKIVSTPTIQSVQHSSQMLYGTELT
jgi:hypothetical protein